MKRGRIDSLIEEMLRLVSTVENNTDAFPTLRSFLDALKEVLEQYYK